MSVVRFHYLINGLCIPVMAAMKTHGSRERCVAREIPSPKVQAAPVALGRVLRSCLTESQWPFLCISGQKLDKSWILRWKLEEGVRQLQVTAVQVPALSQPHHVHIMLPKNCLATTPPPQNVILLLLLQHNRRKKRINTLLNLKPSHCPRQCYSH